MSSQLSATETGLDLKYFRAEGGTVPLALHGKGRAGTMIVSGLEKFSGKARP